MVKMSLWVITFLSITGLILITVDKRKPLNYQDKSSANYFLPRRPSPTQTPFTPSPTLSAIDTEVTKKPTVNPTKNQSSTWSLKKVDEHLTVADIPADPKMSTPDELFDAMNNYRTAHNVQTLAKDDLLCTISQRRADELQAKGGLDNHEGFTAREEEFADAGFKSSAEVLYFGEPLYGVHLVEFGWDRSLTGHREAIQTPNFNRGCGGTTANVAVFILGEK